MVKHVIHTQHVDNQCFRNFSNSVYHLKPNKMGVTIHYRGNLKSPDMVNPLIEDLEDICRSADWKYSLLEPKELSKETLAEIPAHFAHLRGISFKPHEESEPLQFIFNEHGEWRTFLNVILGDKLPKGLKNWAFVKTQFAGPETHIAVINLLIYLRKKYFKKLEIKDEGGYYPKKNSEDLHQRMGFINNAIATIHDVFEHGDFSDNPEEMIEQMKDAISRSLKDVKVEVMKFDMNNLPPSLRRELNEEQEEDDNDN
jgi:hypothetical protein